MKNKIWSVLIAHGHHRPENKIMFKRVLWQELFILLTTSHKHEISSFNYVRIKSIILTVPWNVIRRFPPPPRLVVLVWFATFGPWPLLFHRFCSTQQLTDKWMILHSGWPPRVHRAATWLSIHSLVTRVFITCRNSGTTGIFARCARRDSIGWIHIWLVIEVQTPHGVASRTHQWFIRQLQIGCEVESWKYWGGGGVIFES